MSPFAPTAAAPSANETPHRFIDPRKQAASLRAADDDVRSVFSALLREAGHEGWKSAAPQTERVTAERAVASWEGWIEAHRSRSYGFDRDGGFVDRTWGPQRNSSVRQGKGFEDLQQDFGRIVHRAVQAGAYAAPEAWLRTLSAADLAALQQVHHLADPIDPHTLSREEALNLLLPPAATVDLDGNSVMSVGCGLLGRFPDSRTPPAVVQAWEKVTQGMTDEQKLILAFDKIGSYIGPENIHLNSRGECVRVSQPGDPDFFNGREAAGFSWTGFAARKLEDLEFFRSQIEPAQYARDRAFWSSFHDALQEAGA
jgi:hypothetical protein